MAASELACFGGHPVMRPWDLVEAPLLDSDDERAASEIIRTRGIEPVGGKHNEALRSEWAAAVKARHCLPLNSGMAALQASLVAVGIEPGDEVIVPALTFTATATAVARVQGNPIFADTRLDTYELDVADAKRKLTGRTRAIVPVHVHGLPCDMAQVSAFADEAGLRVVEDAAQAVGATLDGVHVGAWGPTAWSHSRGKPVMAGGGGQVTTNDDEAFAVARLFVSQGENRPALGNGEHRSYECVLAPSDNYRMTEHTAALVRGQLRRLPSYLTTARANAAVLTAGLGELPGIVTPAVPEGRESSWTYFRFGLDLGELGWPGSPTHARDNVVWALFAEGVPVTTWLLRGLDRLPGFRRRRDGSLAPVDPDSCAVTQRTLDCTAVLGAAPYMLHVQPLSTIRRIVAAFEKVFSRPAITRVLNADHHPLKVVPPLTSDYMDG